MSETITHYLAYYLGCHTNKGKLIGIHQNTVFTEFPHGNIMEHDITRPEFSIQLQLKRLSDLSIDQSSELIRKGFSIGRPRGYSFSPDAFLYLLSLHVDLFGLIDSGLATDMAINGNEPLP